MLESLLLDAPADATVSDAPAGALQSDDNTPPDDNAHADNQPEVTPHVTPTVTPPTGNNGQAKEETDGFPSVCDKEGSTPPPPPLDPSPRPPCRHCHGERKRRQGHRGLCRSCYRDAYVRSLYPPPVVTVFDGVGLGRNAGKRLADAPVKALPGSEAKIAELERRAAAGLALWHPADGLGG